MARKRGGAAGAWDRNKGWLKSVVPGVLGMIPGVGVPLAVAAGAAMRGFDREGKGGIGFDLGQGIRGGLEGYGMGKLGQSAGGSIRGMLAPKAAALPSVAAPDTIGMTNTMLPPKASAARFATATPAGAPTAGAQPIGALAKTGDSAARFATATPVGAPTATAQPIGALAKTVPQTPSPGTMSRMGQKATKAMDFANKYEKPLGAMIRGTGMVPNPEAEALAAKNQIEQDKLEFERQQYADAQGRQMRIAQLLVPMYQEMMAGRGGSPSNLPGGMPGASVVRDFGAPDYQSLAIMQGAVPGFGQYADMDEGDDEVAPLRTGVAPLRTGVAPLRTGVAPLRTGVSPLSSTVSPMRTSVRPLRR